jgi:hypothetical protein
MAEREGNETSREELWLSNYLEKGESTKAWIEKLAR